MFSARPRFVSPVGERSIALNGRRRYRMGMAAFVAGYAGLCLAVALVQPVALRVALAVLALAPILWGARRVLLARIEARLQELGTGPPTDRAGDAGIEGGRAGSESDVSSAGAGESREAD